MKTSFGFFSFTEVTDPAEHRAYNEWHQLDHLPEQFPSGIVYGQRWSRRRRVGQHGQRRIPRPDPLLTCYLMAEPIESTLDDFFDLGARLHDLDRFHRHRRAHLTGPFRVSDATAAPRVLVSAEAVPFRAHRGLYVVVEEHRDGDALVDYQRWLAGTRARAASTGIAGMWTFASSEVCPLVGARQSPCAGSTRSARVAARAPLELERRTGSTRRRA
jgi:hypothetical protein